MNRSTSQNHSAELLPRRPFQDSMAGNNLRNRSDSSHRHVAIRSRPAWRMGTDRLRRSKRCRRRSGRRQDPSCSKRPVEPGSKPARARLARLVDYVFGITASDPHGDCGPDQSVTMQLLAPQLVSILQYWDGFKTRRNVSYTLDSPSVP